MPELEKGRLPGGNPALCPRSGPHVLALEMIMIPLVRCPLCLEVNYLEAGALPLHLQLTHLTPMAVPHDPPAAQTRAHDDSSDDDLVCACGRAWSRCALAACGRAVPSNERDTSASASSDGGVAGNRAV